MNGNKHAFHKERLRPLSPLGAIAELTSRRLAEKFERRLAFESRSFR